MSEPPSAKFLIVDDQPESLILLTEALQSLPVEITIMSSGEAAIAAAIQWEFALILLDVKMPGLDGFETASRIRAIPHCAATPIIFMSAHAIQPDEIFQGYETGAIDYLIKPIHLKILLSKAKFYLQFFQQKQALKLDGDHREQNVRNELESINDIILSAISDAVFITKASGDFTFICSNVHHIFGYTVAEVEAMGQIQKLLGDFSLEHSQLTQTGELTNCPFTICDKAGTTHSLLVNIKKVNIKGGNYLFTCRDISERVKAERIIQENEINFRNIFSHVSDGLVVLSHSRQVCFANTSAETLLNQSPQVIVERVWESDTTEHHFEWEIPSPDHGDRTIDVVISDLFWQGERAKLAALRDITERKLMENQLRANEQKYYHLLENIHSGVIVHAIDTRILYANPAAKDFLGLSDLEGRTVLDKRWTFFNGDGDLIPFDAFPLNQVLTSQKPLVNFEMGIFRQDLNVMFWALVNAYPEFNDQRELSQIIVTFVDITERKQAEIVLKTVNENLATVVEDRTQALEATNEQLLQEIAEKEKIGQILAHQEARYRALIRGASDAILVTTMNLEILEVNQRAIAMSGYEERELIHQSLIDLNLFPDKFNHYHRDFWRNLKTHQLAQLLDTTLRTKSGEMLFIDISASVITYENDAIIKFMVHDITLQKTIRIQLERENYFRQQVLDNMVEGLCICQDITEFPFVKFSVWNPMMEKITGYSQTDINQLGWYQQLYPDPTYRQRAIARMKEMRKGNNLNGEEWQIIRKDGAVRTIKISTALLMNPNNDTNILALIQDVTSEKEQLKIIQENELQFRSIVENLPIFFGMRTVDHSHWYYINPAFKTLTDYHPQEMYEDPLLWQKFYHPEDLEKFAKRLHGVPFPYGEWMDFRMFKKDGTEIWVRVLEFLIDEEYAEPRVVTFGQDITEIKKAEEDIRNALVKERELNQIKTQFVDIVSHEFRTPLTSILGFSELLIRHFDRLSAEKKLHYIRNIQQASDRLSQLIDDVLRISQYDAHKLNISLGNTKVETLGNEIIEALSSGLGNRHHLQLICHLPADFTCLLDVNLLRHILENLLSNAIKYSPIGSRVTLDISRTDDFLAFQVSDQGIGIPQADQDALFEAFHRASNVGDIPGTGLGLSIVKRYADFLGGTVSFTSAPDQGTTFMIRLPLLFR